MDRNASRLRPGRPMFDDGSDTEGSFMTAVEFLTKTAPPQPGPSRPPSSRVISMGAMYQDPQAQPVVTQQPPLHQVTEEQSEEEEGLAELMEFVRNKTPPPSNYMSIPDSFSTTSASSSERRKWWRFRMFRKRKKPAASKKHRPPPIKLPDTAIAGTTVDGYRHIAISIPIEHAHLESGRKGRRSKRKDKKVSKPEKLIPAKAGSVKTIVSDRGVVTVLKPVTEDRESLSSKSLEHMLSSAGVMRPQTPKGRYSMSKHSYDPIDSPVYPAIPDIPEELPEYSSRPRTADPSHARHVSNSSMHSFSSAPNSPVRRRASAQPSTKRPSAPKDLVDDFINRHSHHRRETSGDTLRQSNVSERPTSSRAVLGGAEPVARDARSTKRSSMNTIVSREPRASSSRNSVVTIVPTNKSKQDYLDESAAQGRGVSPLTKENLARASLERRISTLSQQDNDQEMKESAFEASLTAPEDVHRDISEAFKIVERLVESQKPPELPKPKTRASSVVDDPRPTSKCSTSTFTPIMVVAEVQPEVPPPAVDLSVLRNKISQLQIAAQPQALRPISPANVTKSLPSTRLSSLISAAARIPTPPRSPQLPPEPPSPVDSAPQPIPLDRTSLARRREWAAEREREKEEKERQRLQGPQREHSVQRPQTARASMSLPPKRQNGGRKRYSLGATSEAAHNNPQEEPPRGRYVHSRDKHVIEMERRLRRLERDGNAWLGAMMPLLNNLNQTLGKLQDDEDDEWRRKEWGDGYRDIPDLDSFRSRPSHQYYEQEQQHEEGVEEEFAVRPSRRPQTADATRHRRLSMQSDFEPRGRSQRSRSRQSQTSRQSWAGGPPSRSGSMAIGRDRHISPYKMPLHEEPEESQQSWHQRDERRRTVGQAPRDLSEFRRAAAGFRSRSNSGDSRDSMVLGGGGLDNLEPLMRELMGGSRLGRESPVERRVPLDEDPETAFAMF